MEFTFTNPLGRWDARRELWTMMSVGEAASDAIAARAEGFERGFGSVRVEVTVGSSTWQTSIFPSEDAYVLPIKKSVRDRERLELGAPVTASIRLLDL